jgi:hypothetical protein
MCKRLGPVQGRACRAEMDIRSSRRGIMALRFIGKDPDSPNGDSPSVWDDGDDFVIQGWKISDPGEVSELLRAAGQKAVPGHEALIRFPKRLMHFFVEGSG